MSELNKLLYKVLLNLHIFLALNKNCTEPYVVRYKEAIYIYTDKNHCSISFECKSLKEFSSLEQYINKQEVFKCVTLV